MLIIIIIYLQYLSAEHARGMRHSEPPNLSPEPSLNRTPPAPRTVREASGGKYVRKF